MKILLVHNFYQHPGGEDSVFKTEKEILHSYGHQVTQYTDSNHRITNLNRINSAFSTILAKDSYRYILVLLHENRPDIVHIHNTFLLISPSVYYACQKANIPVIQTLHNYRILCPTATFFRNNSICERCLGKSLPWPGVIHSCYRNSMTQSLIVAIMLAYHRMRKTWHKQVDQFIALTEFAKLKFIEGGLAPEKLSIKPNCISPDPGIGIGDGDFILFVGRLSFEKGIETLVKSWEHINTGLQLKIVGDGPLSSTTASFAQRYSNVEWLGNRPREEGD